MSGHLFLHIGPPKSGTTSLQYALDKIDHPDFVFAGAFQPRSRNNRSLSQRLIDGARHGGNASQLDSEAACAEISQLVNSGKSVVISEEMLLVTQPDITWMEKISNLKALLGDIPTTIILTLRDPGEALTSLYQEIYRGLPLRLKFDFGAFCRSERASCYDYQRVRDELGKVGFPRVRFIDFDAIRNGRLSSRDIFGKQDVLGMADIPLGHTNSGNKRGDGKQRHLEKVTLKSVGQVPAARWLINRCNLRSNPLYLRIVKVLDSVSIRPGGYRTLVVPPPQADRFATSYEAARLQMREQVLDDRPSSLTVQES